MTEGAGCCAAAECDDLPLVSVFVGEIIPWELQLVDLATGTPEDLAGRSFAASILRFDGTEAVSIAGTVVPGPDPHVEGVFPGAVTAGLAGLPGLKLQIAELFDADPLLGRMVLVDRRLRVLRAPTTLSVDAAEPSNGTPTTRYRVEIAAHGSRVAISERGARGYSAAFQAHAEDPAVFQAPTAPAFIAGLRLLAGSGSGGSGDAGAGDYARAMGDYAKAQGQVATTAATGADAAAERADTAAGAATTKAALADTKAGYAQTQGDYAKAKGQLAGTAAAGADTAAGAATTKAALAASKADYAEAQADYAKAQGVVASAAAAEADAASGRADAAAGRADTQAGYAQTQGDFAKAQGQLAGTAATGADAAAGRADTAAGAANTKAALADTKAGYAQTQGDFAKAQGQSAGTAATGADAAAGRADTAAGTATAKATLADTAAGTASTKAALADTKAGYAQTQGDYAKAQGLAATTAAAGADAAAGRADTAAGTATAKAGYAQTQGDYAKAQGLAATTAATGADAAAGRADTAAGTATAKATLADTKAGYAQTQGDYAKAQGLAATTAAIGADAAAGRADTAAGTATAKATLADTKAGYAQTQGDYAKAQGLAASTAATGADAAAGRADTAAGTATAKATLADTKAGYAQTQGDYAKAQGLAASTAATGADAAAGRADTAAGTATTKAALADTKAGYAQIQGDYAKAQGDRLAAYPLYDVLPSPLGADQGAELVTAFNTLGRVPGLPPGSNFYLDAKLRPAATALLALDARSDFHAALPNVTFTMRWDPTSDATIDATLGRMPLSLTDWVRSSLTGFALDLSPKPAFTGTIEALVVPNGLPYATALVIRPLAGEEVAFRSADKIEIIDPDTLKVVDWLHYKAGPGPLVQNPDGTFTWTPVPRAAAITQIYALSPLTVRAGGNKLSDGMLTTVTDVPGLEIAGVSVVNGKTFIAKPGRFDGDRNDNDGGSDDDDDDEIASSYIRLCDRATGLPIDATGATASAGGGTISGVGVPVTAAVGMLAELHCRKRAGANMLGLFRCRQTKVEPWIRRAASLGVTALACDDMDFGNWRVENGSAGGLLARDCGGYFNAGDWVAREIGDCAWAVRAVDPTPFITSVDTATNTIFLAEGWTDGSKKGTFPRRPVKGQLWTFHQDGARVTTKRVTAVTDTSVSFPVLPVGYDPATWQITTAYTASQRHGRVLIDGNASSAMTAQTDNFVAESITFIRVRGDGLRVSQPAVGKPGGSGAGEGISVGKIIARLCGGKFAANRGGVLTFRRLTNIGTVSTVPQDTRAHYVGEVDVDQIDGNVINAQGFKARIDRYRQRRTGLKRGAATAAMPLQDNDIFAVQGEVELGEVIGEMPKIYEGANGFVPITSGSLLTTAVVLATAGQTTFDMVKPVRVGDQPRITITVDGIAIPAAMLTANGTRTVTIDTAYATNFIFEKSKMIGVHTRC